MTNPNRRAGKKLSRGERARQRALRSLQNEVRKHDNITNHGRDSAAAVAHRRASLTLEQLEHASALADAEFEQQRARAAAEALGISRPAPRGRC